MGVKHKVCRKGMKMKPVVKLNDDGTTSTVMINARMIEERVGIKINTAIKRLCFSTTYEKAFAPKGLMVGHQYSYEGNASRKMSFNKKAHQTMEAEEITDKANISAILLNKPFYSDPFYRLALIAI